MFWHWAKQDAQFQNGTAIGPRREIVSEGRELRKRRRGTTGFFAKSAEAVEKTRDGEKRVCKECV